MHVHLSATATPLATMLAKRLTRFGFTIDLDAPSIAYRSSTLRLPAGADPVAAARLLTALQPLPIALAVMPGLHAARLELATATLDPDTHVRVVAANPRRLAAVVARLQRLGIEASAKHVATVRRPRLETRDMTPDQAALLGWVTAIGGPPPAHHDKPDLLRWSAVVHLPDEPLRAQPELRVRLHTDDEAQLAPFLVYSVLSGMSVEIVPALHGLSERRFLYSGPTHPHAAGTLLELAHFLQRAGVDMAQMPLMPAPVAADWPLSEDETPTLDVSLPLGLHLMGDMRPYAGSEPRRYRVQVRAADSAAAWQAVEALKIAGFHATPLLGQPLDLADIPEATEVRADDLLDDPASLALLQQTLAGAVDLAVGPEARAVQLRTSTFEHVHIELVRKVDLPDPAQRRRRQLSKCNLVLYVDDRKRSQRLRKAVGDWAGTSVQVTDMPEDQAPRIRFGGAPRDLIESLAAAVQPFLDAPIDLDACWSEEDLDIWLFAPASALIIEPEDDSDPFGETWGRPAPHLRGFLDVCADAVRVGSVWLNKRPGARHPSAPDAALLDSMCLDSQTAALLAHVAAAVVADEPCLLEGPTSATKTSGIMLLAALLGQPVLRLNLSSQLDTSELIGQHVPAPDGGFRWQDGAAVRAATEGLWLVLDEINLGPPQVVERLNALLERPRTLTLAERDHRVLGTAEHPIHPQFRVFATMNPAEYAGRSALSPAGKDRWLRQLLVVAPDATAIEAMLRHALWGEQPELPGWGPALLFDGRTALRWPVCPVPGDHAVLDAFVRHLARLHAMVLTADLGSERREGYVFTRRGLLSLLQRLRLEVEAGRALDDALRIGLRQTYVDRVAAPDRQALALLMDAEGLGPRTWSLPQSQPIATQAVLPLGGVVGRYLRACVAEAM